MYINIWVWWKLINKTYLETFIKAVLGYIFVLWRMGTLSKKMLLKKIGNKEKDIIADEHHIESKK